MTPVLLVMLSLFGGIAWYNTVTWWLIWCSITGTIIISNGIDMVRARRIMVMLVPVFASAALNNFDIRLIPVLIAVLVFVQFSDEIESGIHPAAIYFLALVPFAETITGLNLSSNVLATWAYIYAIYAIFSRRYGVAVCMVIVILAMLSRGGIVGLLAGVLYLILPDFPPAVRSRWMWIVPLAIIAFCGLWMIRPSTAEVRVAYLVQAITAYVDYGPLQLIFGDGPGSIARAGMIVDWRYGNIVIHAHNTLMDWLLEYGFFGVCYWGWYARQIWLHRYLYPRWRIAALIAIAAHGMVDDPLYMPGVACMIIMLQNRPGD